ncbi:multidrug effflux MFS transporter [Mycobacterium yunnanensis]|uniref:Multidrug effflux MFS transporter n=1 Tax=Mycobacterium yunnanensis TaxID=368477 RepID=A0A9X3C1J9_9MYCO|nr:multidrug effflux MFS transporter [Mycobacterium yunnanensis]MCV7420306.1 multidrug effflux MFS transporter [Mycobacterium yunnanensis]
MTNAPAPPRHLLAILLCVIPLSQIPLDVYTPALPQMVVDLGSTPAALQGTVTVYMLGLAVGFIPVGVMADAWGRKRVLLASLVVVVATSVLCAVAPNVGFLLAVRFLQGLAACACMVLSYAVAADSFRGPKLTSVSGILGAAWGLAPVIAPAVGGVLVQYTTWRMVFGLVAVLAAAVAVLVATALPETLAPTNRTPIAVRATSQAVAHTMRNPVFGCFVLVFGLMASTQLAFGVAGPFLYQAGLGFAPAAYGAIALAVGAANLLGELACGYFAVRISTRKLACGALAAFALGTAVLLVSALTIGLDAWALTIGAALALAGCGVLCPQMYGLALGLFTKNLGLVGGIASAGCYLIVSVALAAVGALPENDQSTLGWLYVVCGAAAFVLLIWATAERRARHSQLESPPPIREQSS